MNPKPKRMSRRRLCAVACATMYVMGAAIVAKAGEPVPVEVTPVKQIEIGTIAPGEARVINYDMPQAAEFLITAKRLKWITISVAVDDLESQSPTQSDEQSNQLILTTSGFNCAYSIDEGETWARFESDDLSVTLKVPASPTPANQTGRIMLRIGGSVTAGESQQRGAYLGGIVVSAEYGKNDGGGPGSVLEENELDDDEYFTLPGFRSSE